MTRSEMLNRLEFIYEKMEYLEHIIAEKSNQNQNTLLLDIKEKEQAIKQQLVMLENKYSKEKQDKQLYLAIAR